MTQLISNRLSRNVHVCAVAMLTTITGKDRLIKNYSHLAWGSGEGNGTPLQYSCLENPMDGGAWKAAVHKVAEGRTWLSDFTFTFHFHALEKEMAAHTIFLPGEPQEWEPGGLPSMASHRVGHDWSDLAAAAAAAAALNPQHLSKFFAIWWEFNEHMLKEQELIVCVQCVCRSILIYFLIYLSCSLLQWAMSL